MILVKPDANEDNRGNDWSGVARQKPEVMAMLRKNGWPPPEGWYEGAYLWNGYDIQLLGDLDFNSRLNMIDVLFDPSSVEGFGLLLAEAGRCKRPVLGLKDYHVRDEVYGSSRFILPAIEPELWETWHTGARLVKFDPREAAEEIAWLSEAEPELLKEKAEAGYMNTLSYTWENATSQMVNIMKEVLCQKQPK
jgi:glycosyltransferase involved in cell wall biosynthesis